MFIKDKLHFYNQVKCHCEDFNSTLLQQIMIKILNEYKLKWLQVIFCREVLHHTTSRLHWGLKGKQTKTILKSFFAKIYHQFYGFKQSSINLFVSPYHCINKHDVVQVFQSSNKCFMINATNLSTCDLLSNTNKTHWQSTTWIIFKPIQPFNIFCCLIYL